MTMIFLVLPCPITVAVTRAPSRTGEPTLAACPSATSRTRSRVTEVPGSARNRSTFSVRPIALAHANRFRRPVVQPHHLLPFLADRRALQFLQRRSFGHAQPLEVHPFTRPHAEPPAGLLFYVPDPPLALAEEKPMHIGVHVG